MEGTHIGTSGHRLGGGDLETNNNDKVSLMSKCLFSPVFLFNNFFFFLIFATSPTGTKVGVVLTYWLGFFIIVKFGLLCFLIVIPGWLSDIHSYSCILHSRQERDFATVCPNKHGNSVTILN